MPQPAASASGAWYTGKLFRVAAWTFLIVAMVVEGYYAVFVRLGDVPCHIMYGEEFRAGTPYVNPGNYYPLGRVMFDTLFTFADVRVTRTVFYVVSLLAFAGCFYLCSRILPIQANDSDTKPVESRQRNFAAAVVTIVVLAPFLIRDFDECGLQILLLSLCLLGMHSFLRGHKLTSGFWLAAAATYKATPLLFLPFLLWKREWKAAGAMAVCVVGLNLLPAAYIGWDKTIDANRYWFAHTRAITRDVVDAYPSVPGLENPKHQNESLSATFARLVETYPPGHPLHLNHPLFVQFGNLGTERAKIAVKLMIVLLGGIIAWKMRRGYTAENRQSLVPTEWAVACMYSALLSPLCWKQHLVLFVPAVFFLARSVLDDERPSRGRVVAMFVISAAFFWTHRMVWGTELSEVITSYNPVTFAAIGLTFLVLSTRVSRVAKESVDQDLPGVTNSATLRAAA